MKENIVITDVVYMDILSSLVTTKRTKETEIQKQISIIATMQSYGFVYEKLQKITLNRNGCVAAFIRLIFKTPPQTTIALPGKYVQELQNMTVLILQPSSDSVEDITVISEEIQPVLQIIQIVK